MVICPRDSIRLNQGPQSSWARGTHGIRPLDQPPQTASCLLATRGPRQVRGRRWRSCSIFVLLSQHAAQNTLPNLILQILPRWMEPEISIPLFIYLFLSLPTDLKIDHRGSSQPARTHKSDAQGPALNSYHTCKPSTDNSFPCGSLAPNGSSLKCGTSRSR